MEVPESINSYRVPSQFATDVFRTYDIRGPVAPDGITEDLTYAIGLAIGSEAQAVGESTVIIGRDGRLSGPALLPALIAGLRASGCDVIDIGLVSSPVLYFATKHLSAKTGVMMTASHNPGHHNGFKTILAGETLSTAGVAQLKERILAQDFHLAGELGSYIEQNIDDAYLQCIVAKCQLARPLKVVVDCGNGMAGPYAPQLYRSLGCEVIALYDDVDGNFPNHHPDPTVPKNLVDIQAAVREHNADLGLAFDGDADRVGVVTNSGQIIWPDRQLMLYATEVLRDHPGAKIVFDVKCSKHLAAVIEGAGGIPVMSQTGHSILKARMLAENAPLAGEMSGHVFFNDDWFGFDDGVYVGARLLQILAAQDVDLDMRFAEFPAAVFTPEIKVPMPEEQKAPFLHALLAAPELQDGERITIDGLRVEWADGWGLVRQSNTSAYLTMRFEADDQTALERVQDIFRRAMLAIDPEIALPF